MEYASFLSTWRAKTMKPETLPHTGYCGVGRGVCRRHGRVLVKRLQLCESSWHSNIVSP